MRLKFNPENLEIPTIMPSECKNYEITKYDAGGKWHYMAWHRPGGERLNRVYIPSGVARSEALQACQWHCNGVMG